MSLSISKQITDFTKKITYDDLPEDLIDIIKNAFLDYTGVSIAGCKENSVMATLEYAKNSSGKEESKIFGHNLSLSVEFASLVNATSSHVLDYDDVSWATIGHPSVVIAPVCFSMAQKYNKSGKDMILAYAIASEVMHKLAKLTMPYVSENGWHTTSIYGVFGAVIAAAILKESSKEEIINAIGIASSKASGVRSNFGTDVKSYHAGMACYNGIESLYLASFGLKSSDNSIEGSDGFIQIYAGLDLKDPKLDFSSNWDLLTNGLVFKQYPCCSGSHPASDLIKEMIEKYSISVNDIENIKVGCSILAPKELKCDFPKTALEAKFSMRYAIASMLIYGNLSLNEFSDEKVQNDEIQNLMQRISVDIDDEFKKLGFIGTSPARIKIYHKNKVIYEDINMLAKGNPNKELSNEEMKKKFLQCTDDNVTLYDFLSNLESLERINNMLKYC